MSIWGGANANPADPLTADAAFMPPEGSPTAGSPGTPGAVGTFNPFGADIWRPSASTAPSGWNLPTPTTLPAQTPTDENNMKN